MSINDIFKIILIFSLCLIGHATDEHIEVTCNINVKKPTHCVSDKFLSISVDPAVLLAGVNLSEKSLGLAKHLSPAFIRIAGPTTQFIKYNDIEDGSRKFLSDDGDSVKITPSMWFGINEWLKLAKLTPIYGLNDREVDKDLWNPKSTLPLFEISEQLNVSCYWQLGYDNSDKNEARFTQNLNILHYILEAYNRKNQSWKIIGSDISTMPENQVENIMMKLINVTESVMWEPTCKDVNQFPQKDIAYKILQRPSSKPRVKVWTTAPKSSGPITFASALLWAKHIGNVARMGYDVVFRQPRILELFTDTPIYWCSLLHKKLMGCNVLETKSNLFLDDMNIFAHCTRKQNSFVRRGALTVMVINDHSNKYKVKVKLGNTLPEKSMEVQSYILTSTCANSTETYLNGKLLTPAVFHEKQPFEPKIRRTKSATHILLALPPSSIGFFVLPGARVPICIDNESETHLLLEEIEEDQNMPFSEEVALQLGQRGTFHKHNLLEEITHNLKNEMNFDEKYYKNFLKQDPTDLDVAVTHQAKDKVFEKMDEKDRKHFIDRVKFTDKHKKVFDFEKKRENLKKYLLDKAKFMKHELTPEKKVKKLELTSDEIDNLLKERAIERAAQKNIVFTDEELEALLKKASKNFNKSRSKASTKKRAINLPMLEKYSRMNQNQNFNGHHNTAIRKTSNLRNKKHARGRRAVNVDLGDLKAKIAERKRFWDDKREEILGNTLTMKENIRDKIRGLKSNFRFRRDINMDLLNKNTKEPKNVKKTSKSSHKTKEAIEATIQTSSAVPDGLQDPIFETKDTTGTNGDIFAELADSEELEEQFFNDANNALKHKKHNLFDKKIKVDPFGVEHPTVDIVEPVRRKHRGKPKTKSDDRLQFLTTSEEFTDIEEDLPCIHEYFGPEYSKKKGAKANENFPEINEYYDHKIFKKRSVATGLEEASVRNKRDMGVAVIEIFDDEVPSTDLQNLIDDPVLDRPFLNGLFEFSGKLDDDNKLKKAFYETEERDITNDDKSREENKQIDEKEEASTSSEKSEKKTAKDVNTKDSNDHPDEAQEHHILRKRSIDFGEKMNKRKMGKANSITDKKIKKKYKSLNNLNDHMHVIRERIQERKDDIDRLVQRQKEIDSDRKEQWKSKLHMKTRSNLNPTKEDLTFDFESPKLLSRKKDSENEASDPDHVNRVRRSIFQTRFGNYQPFTSNLNPWQPSDISSLKRDYYIANSNLIPPNDYYVFKNVFNKPYDIRKRRSIDTDVDFLGNNIDTSINEIKKDYDKPRDGSKYGYDFGKSKNTADIKDEDFFKFKLPNNEEFEIIDQQQETIKPTNDKIENAKDIHVSTDENQVGTNTSEYISNDKSENEVDEGQLDDFNISNYDENGKVEIGGPKDDLTRFDVVFAQDLLRLKLPNEDELDLINNGEDTEIKLIHNINNSELPEEDIKELVPEIAPRTIIPIQGVDKLMGDIKNFFNNVGRDLKSFFDKFNIN